MGALETASQLFGAFVGSIGYCMIFGMRAALIAPACAGSLICWLAYLFAAPNFTGPFPAVCIASMIGSLYAELLARVMRAPDTLFVVPALIVLIPGRSLYLSMSAMAASDWAAASASGYTTLRWALGIAVGFSAVQAVLAMASNARALARRRH